MCDSAGPSVCPFVCPVLVVVLCWN